MNHLKIKAGRNHHYVEPQTSISEFVAGLLLAGLVIFLLVIM